MDRGVPVACPGCDGAEDGCCVCDHTGKVWSGVYGFPVRSSAVKIYVASSWRNVHQPLVVEHLRDRGMEVYDFRNPPHGRGGFAWSQIDPQWQKWDPKGWRDGLKSPLAVEGFNSDKRGMDWAEACVLVLPSGRSSHLEAGYMAGQGKPVAVLALEPAEPDLMVGLLSGGILTSYGELDDWLHDMHDLPRGGA